MTSGTHGDPMERAHDAACARIDRRLRELGMADAFGGQMPGGLMPDYGSQGTLLIYRPRTRDGVVTSEPDYIGVMDDEPWLSEADLEALDRHASRHVRRTLRRRAIEAAGQDEIDPAWSFTMHRLARAMLLAVEIDPAMFTDGRDKTVTLAARMLAEQKNMALDDRHVEDGRIDIHSIAWRGLQFGGKGKPFALVDQPMPETLVTALVGRKLSEAISHPAVDRAGPIRIVAADTTATYTTFVLEDVQDFVRRPPPGTDRGWLRVPFMPTNTD